MAKVSPYHSTCDTDRPVYHDWDDCTEGNNIEKHCKKPGTAGRRRCERCIDKG